MISNGNPDSPGIIIEMPDYAKLKADVEKLRTELSMLVLERDDLLYQECKNIEMVYMLSIGGLEYRTYEIECAIRRSKRKLELIQLKKNRQEKVILSMIEAVLDSEFSEYQAKLTEQVDKMNAALNRSHGQMLTDEENREMKKLYRSIVKSLHPDLHPDLSEARIQLFLNAVNAYKHGDLSELRIISEMANEPTLPDMKSDGITLLIKEKDRLSKLLKSVNDKILEIKSEYPYTMKSFIQSPDEINARKSELEEKIKQLNEVLDIYTVRIEDMLR